MVVVVDTLHRAVRYVVTVVVLYFRTEQEELPEDAPIGVRLGVETAPRLVAPVARTGLETGCGDRQIGIFHIQGRPAAVFLLRKRIVVVAVAQSQRMAEFVRQGLRGAAAFNQHATWQTQAIGLALVSGTLANVAYKIHIYAAADIVRLNEGPDLT